MATDKEQPEKIFCLFHKRTDCTCIVPGMDEATLKAQLAGGSFLIKIFSKRWRRRRFVRNCNAFLFESLKSS
jgi:hypothetical protein